jgi:uncharacterized protein (AIM24 family)
MQSRITGTTMPVLEFVLEPNESVVSEAGELSWMGSSIQMTTHTQFAGGGGLFGVIKRVAGGGSIFMTEYRAIGAPGEVAFAPKLPGHIATAFYVRCRKFRFRLDFSNHWARAYSAAMVSCCKG